MQYNTIKIHPCSDSSETLKLALAAGPPPKFSDTCGVPAAMIETLRGQVGITAPQFWR